MVWRKRYLGLVACCLLTVVLLTSVVGVALAEDRRGAIPWGAMYVPNEAIAATGMTGVIKTYRGTRGAEALLEDLDFARSHDVRLILTLGTVAPSAYLDAEGHLDLDAVAVELLPFFGIADRVAPYITDGTIWGIRFLDEPHDPSGYPRDFEIDPGELGEAYALIREHFGDVRIGSTAPPAYMVRVAGAGFAAGQVVHGRLPDGFEDPVAFHIDQSELAHASGLAYIASLNANTNLIDNLTFFRDYRRMCSIETVDFVTAWQWPQGHHPMPSFEVRLNDPDPRVQAEIDRIPTTCER